MLAPQHWQFHDPSSADGVVGIDASLGDEMNDGVAGAALVPEPKPKPRVVGGGVGGDMAVTGDAPND